MTHRAPHGPPRSFRQDWESWSPRERVLLPLGALAIIAALAIAIWASV